MSEISFQVRASLIAGILLLLRELLPAWTGLPKTVAATLALAGAGKSQAYKMRDRLRELLPTVIGTPGRPASQPTDHCSQCSTIEVVQAVQHYIMAHPGSACNTGKRCFYSDGFRRFVVGLVAPGQPGEGVSESQLAHLTGVPQGTLHDWLYPKQRHVQPSTSSVDPGPVPSPTPPSDTSEEMGTLKLFTARGAHTFLITSLWPHWEGTFRAFCQMLRHEHRLKCGNTFMGNVLQGMGLRHRRPQTPVEAPWSSNTFRIFFPGAQWVGDGTEISVRWGDEIFVFNLQAIMDLASAAMMGIYISKTEDEKALHRAYEDGKITSSGVPPLSITLDNKPCNHCPDAHASLADTILLRATPGRGQAKAALEGNFGLFQQELPDLVVTGDTPEEMAACFLRLIAIAYHRGRNGRPRKRLGGSTPADFYGNSKTTPEDIEEWRKWCLELQRREERARLTREARRDPVRLNLLNNGLAEMGIPDPDHRLAVSLAYYCREAIARGIATFKSKQDLGTLPPPDNHGVYLGGIIKNLHSRLELEHFATYILEQRLRLHDMTLIPLNRIADQIWNNLSPSECPQAFVDLALDAKYTVDFNFLARASAQALSALPAADRDPLYRVLTRRIAASFKVERERRADLIDCLAAAMASAA